MSRRYRGLALILLVLHPMAVQAGACKLLSKRCVDGPSTKQIGDYAVNRDCWQWEKQYECESAATDNACASLRAQGCYEIASACIPDAGGECRLSGGAGWTTSRVCRCRMVARCC